MALRRIVVLLVSSLAVLSFLPSVSAASDREPGREQADRGAVLDPSQPTSRSGVVLGVEKSPSEPSGGRVIASDPRDKPSGPASGGSPRSAPDFAFGMRNKTTRVVVYTLKLDWLCPCDTPRGVTAPWTDHATFVRCVKRESEPLLEEGLTVRERSLLIKEADESQCGVALRLR